MVKSGVMWVISLCLKYDIILLKAVIKCISNFSVYLLLVVSVM